MSTREFDTGRFAFVEDKSAYSMGGTDERRVHFGRSPRAVTSDSDDGIPTRLQPHYNDQPAGIHSDVRRMSTSEHFNWRLIGLSLWALLLATTLAWRCQPSTGSTASAILSASRQFLRGERADGAQQAKIDPQVQSYIDLAVARALRDPVGMRDFALLAEGGRPVTDITTAVGRRSKKLASRTPDQALRDDLRVGSCWQLESRSGQLGVRLPHLVHLTHFSIDHIPLEIAADPGQAPRTLHLWGAVDGDINDRRLRTASTALVAAGLEPPLLIGPALTGGFKYALLSIAHYNIHAQRHIQTFEVSNWVRESGMFFGVVVLEVVDNWGANETCLYRVRVHGDQVDHVIRVLKGSYSAREVPAAVAPDYCESNKHVVTSTHKAVIGPARSWCTPLRIFTPYKLSRCGICPFHTYPRSLTMSHTTASTPNSQSESHDDAHATRPHIMMEGPATSGSAVSTPASPPHADTYTVAPSHPEPVPHHEAPNPYANMEASPPQIAGRKRLKPTPKFAQEKFRKKDNDVRLAAPGDQPSSDPDVQTHVPALVVASGWKVDIRDNMLSQRQREPVLSPKSMALPLSPPPVRRHSQASRATVHSLRRRATAESRRSTASPRARAGSTRPIAPIPLNAGIHNHILMQDFAETRLSSADRVDRNTSHTGPLQDSACTPPASFPFRPAPLPLVVADRPHHQSHPYSNAQTCLPANSHHPPQFVDTRATPYTAIQPTRSVNTPQTLPGISPHPFPNAYTQHGAYSEYPPRGLPSHNRVGQAPEANMAVDERAGVRAESATVASSSQQRHMNPVAQYEPTRMQAAFGQEASMQVDARIDQRVAPQNPHPPSRSYGEDAGNVYSHFHQRPDIADTYMQLEGIRPSPAARTAPCATEVEYVAQQQGNTQPRHSMQIAPSEPRHRHAPPPHQSSSGSSVAALPQGVLQTLQVLHRQVHRSDITEDQAKHMWMRFNEMERRYVWEAYRKSSERQQTPTQAFAPSYGGPDDRTFGRNASEITRPQVPVAERWSDRYSGGPAPVAPQGWTSRHADELTYTRLPTAVHPQSQTADHPMIEDTDGRDVLRGVTTQHSAGGSHPQIPPRTPQAGGYVYAGASGSATAAKHLNPPDTQRHAQSVERIHSGQDERDTVASRARSDSIETISQAEPQSYVGRTESFELPYQNVPSPELPTQSRDKGKQRAVEPRPTSPVRVPGLGPARTTDRPTGSGAGDTSDLVNAPVVMLLVKRMEGMNQTMFHFQQAMMSELHTMNHSMTTALTIATGTSQGASHAPSPRRSQGKYQVGAGAKSTKRTVGIGKSSKSAQSGRNDRMQEDVDVGGVHADDEMNEDEDEDEDADMEDNLEEGGDNDNEDTVRLKARVRKLLDAMLGIHDWSTVATMYPPLSAEEIKSVSDRDGKVTCSAENYRIDFHHPWKKFPFNSMARAIFIDNYLATVASGAFLTKPTPASLLTRENIGRILDARMKYCRLLYRRSVEPPSTAFTTEASRRNCMGMRRQTLLKSRRRTLKCRRLTQHFALLRKLEPRNMSGDETDGEVKTHPPTWRIIPSRWQSHEFRAWLWKIDQMGMEDWVKPKATRATRGNPPRVRVLHENGKVEDGVAAVGLPRNCYNSEWLEELLPHERDALDIDDDLYDFSLQ